VTAESHAYSSVKDVRYLTK